MPFQSPVRDARSVEEKKDCFEISTAIDKLQYLKDFNSSIMQAVVKTMEHLIDFDFVSTGNLTFAKRDS